MDWVDVAIVVGGVGVMAWLLHAANLIGHNPYLRIKMHEDLLGGRLPDNLSLEEKHQLLDRGGLAPRTARRTVFHILVVAFGAAILIWLRNS